jgi:hypothetical protein
MIAKKMKIEKGKAQEMRKFGNSEIRKDGPAFAVPVSGAASVMDSMDVMDKMDSLDLMDGDKM